mmetsp:Transcript_58547/g.136179  ORF Transcript_58547/g.136179 Transcript_58547/m.136179 type:complete len:114 (+) Transcript_58547:2-343(+)
MVDETGTPVRIEVPTKYRVVYKSVAVRRDPAIKAELLRSKRLGEEVEMYEWDKTRTWRRVRVEVPKGDDAEDADLEEVDGWMLIRSDKVGLLLQEILPGELEGEEDTDDEAAG